MGETTERGFEGLQLSGALNADAHVENAGDLNSPVTVMVRSSVGSYTVLFRKPGQVGFQDKHTRRIRRNSIGELTGDTKSASRKMAQYAEEAGKHAAVRWQNNDKKTNTLVFLTLDGYCKLAAYVVDQSAGRTWNPYGNPPRQQVNLSFTMPECLAFSDNGFGNPTNTGVGVRFDVTVEQDPNNANSLYVVHLECAAAKEKVEEGTLTTPKNALPIGKKVTTVGGKLSPF